MCELGDSINSYWSLSIYLTHFLDKLIHKKPLETNLQNSGSVSHRLCPLQDSIALHQSHSHICPWKFARMYVAGQ